MDTAKQTTVCEGCGRQYTPRQSTRGRFCSNACRSYKQAEKTCPGCGKTFRVMQSKAAKFTYCSITCKRAANPQVQKTCETCGKQWMVNPSYPGKGRYCSNECRHAGMRTDRVQVTCAVCGKVEMVWPSTAAGGRRCCSNSCAVTLRCIEGFEPGYIKAKVASGHRTDIEALVEDVLREAGIAYEFEKKISRYWIDFYLPAYNVALECDGWMHARPYRRERDQRRDAVLTSRGIRVVRIADPAIRADARGAVLSALADVIPTTHLTLAPGS